MRSLIGRLARCDRAATAVEYGLIVAVTMLMVISLSNVSSNLWAFLSEQIVSALG